MQKKFLTNLGLLLFLNLLVKPFWVLGIDRSVQNATGTGEFGFYFAIVNFSFLFNIILDLGITNFNNRNIAQYGQLLNKHLSGILVMKLLLAWVYFAVMFAVGLSIGYSREQFIMLAWVGLNQFLLSFILYLRSNISGLMMFRTDSFLSVLDRLLMIAFCSVLLWGNVTHGKFRVEWFVYAQTAAYLITALIAWFIVTKKAALRRINWNYPFFVMIIKKSSPFAVLVLLMAFYNRIDPVMIERLLPGNLGEHQSGTYAQAFRLLDAANMIAYLFAVLLLPIFARLIKENKPVEKIAGLSFTLLFVLSATTAIASHFYRQELMGLLYPRHISETVEGYQGRLEQSAAIFSVLMYSFIACSATYVFGTLLTAKGDLKKLNLIAGSGMVISLVLNFILIPRMMANGAAWANLVSQTLTAGAQIILAVSLFRIRVSFRYLFSLIIFVAGTVGAGFIARNLGFEWLPSLGVMLAGSLILAMSLRLLNIRELVSIIRSSE